MQIRVSDSSQVTQPKLDQTLCFCSTEKRALVEVKKEEYSKAKKTTQGLHT